MALLMPRLAMCSVRLNPPMKLLTVLVAPNGMLRTPCTELTRLNVLVSKLCLLTLTHDLLN